MSFALRQRLAASLRRTAERLDPQPQGPLPRPPVFTYQPTITSGSSYSHVIPKGPYSS